MLRNTVPRKSRLSSCDIAEREDVSYSRELLFDSTSDSYPLSLTFEVGLEGDSERC